MSADGTSATHEGARDNQSPVLAATLNLTYLLLSGLLLHLLSLAFLILFVVLMLIIILNLMLSLIRFRRVVGSAGELKIDSEGLQKTGKQRVGRRE